MPSSHRLYAVMGFTCTGVLALAEQFHTVPAALAATVGGWWILRDPAV